MACWSLQAATTRSNKHLRQRAARHRLGRRRRHTERRRRSRRRRELATRTTLCLLRAEPGKGFWIEGRLNSLANLDFTLDFFASATCDPTGFGEGQHYLGSRSTATDADGNARFGFGLPYPPEGSPFITATATDENGNTSEFSQCIVTGPSNDSWPRAYRLDLVQDKATTATFSQYVDKLGQSRWYKFQVEPDSKVTVELSNLPVNYDIVVYKDIAAVYADTHQSAEPERSRTAECRVRAGHV